MYLTKSSNGGNWSVLVFASITLFAIGMISHNAFADTTVNTIPVGYHLQHVAVDPVTNKIYTTEEFNNAVAVIDGSTNKVVDTVTVGTNPNDIAVNPNTDRIYAGGRIIDGSTDTIIGTFPEQCYCGLAVNPETGLVYVGYTNSIEILNGSTNTVMNTISLPNSPQAIAVNPNTNKIYVSYWCYQCESIDVINGSTDKIQTAIPLSGYQGGFDLAADPNTNKIYVAPGDTAGFLLVIDGSSDKITNTIGPLTNPYHVAVNPITDKIYSSSENMIAVINGSTNTISETLDDENGPWAFATNPATNMIYVSNQPGNNVSVINGSNFSAVLTTYDTVTSSPYQITLPDLNPGTSNDRLLVVGVSANNATVSSITFEGSSLRKAVSSFYNNDAEFWYLTNPSGTGNVIVTMSGPTSAVIGAYSFSGVNQTDPIPTVTSSHNVAASSPGISITTKYVNSTVVDLPSMYGNQALESPTCTPQWNIRLASAIIGSSSSEIASSPGNATCSWTGTNGGDMWDDVALEIRSVTTTATDSVSTAPGAPTGLAANAGNATISLSWIAPSSNGGSAITNYNVYRGTLSGSETLLAKIGNATSYNDTSATNGQEYFYKVAAVNSVGESPQSNEASATLDPKTTTIEFSSNTSFTGTVNSNQTVIIDPGVTVTSNGITNYGNITNKGTIQMNGTASLDNHNLLLFIGGTIKNGILNNYQSANTTIEGGTFPLFLNTMNNHGNFTSYVSSSGSRLGYYGQVNNYATGIMQIHSVGDMYDTPFNNYGLVNNYASTDLLFSTLYNNGTYNNYSTLSIDQDEGEESIVNAATGTFNNLVGAQVDIPSRPGFVKNFDNDGTTNNNGAFYNYNEIANHGVFNNNGTIVNDLVRDTGFEPAYVYNYGTFNNLKSGSVNNSGYFDNECKATYNNPGNFTGNAAFGACTTNQTIMINPTSGPAGSQVKVTGNNFTPNHTIAITLDYWSTATSPSTITSNSTGGFTGNFTVPSSISAPGQPCTGDICVSATDNMDSATTKFTVASQPSAPTGLTATATSLSQINLSWSAPSSNGSSPVTGYMIERSKDNGTSWSTIASNTASTSTTYSDTGLAHSTTYTYRVSAINSVGTSPPSNIASATTLNTVPTSPTGLTATPASTQINLGWSAPSDNGGTPVTGYMIERSTNSGTTWTTLVANTGSAGTTYSDTNVLPLTTYTYRVSAINNIGTSSPSNTASASTTSSGPSSPPPTSSITLNSVQSTSGTTSSSNQMTLSGFNTGNGSNQLLVVGISANNAAVSSVTFGGTTLTKAVSSFNNNDAEFWYLKNPSGSGNIIVTMTGSTSAVVGAYAFSGVDQTNPIPTTVTNSNTASSSPTISATTKYANDWVLDLPSIYGGQKLGSPTCTQEWNVNLPSEITGASSSATVSSPGSVTCGWTASNGGDLWDDVAVEIKSSG